MQSYLSFVAFMSARDATRTLQHWTLPKKACALSGVAPLRQQERYNFQNKTENSCVFSKCGVSYPEFFEFTLAPDATRSRQMPTRSSEPWGWSAFSPLREINNENETFKMKFKNTHKICFQNVYAGGGRTFGLLHLRLLSTR